MSGLTLLEISSLAPNENKLSFGAR